MKKKVVPLHLSEKDLLHFLVSNCKLNIRTLALYKLVKNEFDFYLHPFYEFQDLLKKALDYGLIKGSRQRFLITAKGLRWVEAWKNQEEILNEEMEFPK